MTVPCYMYDDQQSGYRYDGSTWTKFGAPASPGTGFAFASAVAAIPSSPLLIYATSGTNKLVRSTDGGATWTSQTVSGGIDFNGVTSMWARAAGELYALKNAGTLIEECLPVRRRPSGGSRTQ